MKSAIWTYSGFLFDIANPSPSEICIQDIAHALSNTARFNGHTPEFYSVAQHSVLVCERLDNSEWRLAALLHDAAEAYIGDITSPLKSMLKEIQVIEARLLATIFERYLPKWQSEVLSFDRLTTIGLHAEIKEADKILLHTEQRDFFHRAPKDGELTLDSQIVPMSPKDAERYFLEKFLEVI